MLANAAKINVSISLNSKKLGKIYAVIKQVKSYIANFAPCTQLMSVGLLADFIVDHNLVGISAVTCILVGFFYRAS